MHQEVPRLDGLADIAGNYRAILCDVWGVVHNGQRAWPDACEALIRFRNSSGIVVMITNAPRPKPPVVAQMAHLGVPDGVYDEVVTSGDVTRSLIVGAGVPAFHIGPERDLVLFEDLGVELTTLEKAGQVVCSGLFDDRTESPEDYAQLLAQIRSRELPFVCANPDIVVEYGDQLIWCAGALARDFSALGGETRIVGKPHREIYQHCLARIDELAGGPLELSQILAVGDGAQTDLAGAERAGLDALFMTAGIHAQAYGGSEQPVHDEVNAFLADEGRNPIGYMQRLIW